MKKFIFPVALVLLGTGSAFATKVAKENKKAIVAGYRLVNNGNGTFSCLNAEKDCSDENVGPVCTWTSDPSVQLRELVSPTMCGTLLHEIPQ
ncbi:hypothetical protein EG346_02130 [Chryseobacterium carnipullorum]|uniref:Uncharacterized protein n=1 Tax=Chryseobacterium carnipullorum TaxID=1124835 RepID=A0A376EFS8_CHRCU|nr:DUF6520 family protein [Chryseobacterium carnipullorum]AZA47067.1 hypothetical protein EG346_02130 [Chryseobacterium carnipullorum]AZA66415.1 hypothetical protein EG345_18235 [Chryseobacterium carnipullorum]STD07658.1 Uncharacterised protein [Chryseobacterium carnipullorum]